MAGEAPDFWWQNANWRAHMLAPAAWLYGAVAGRRLARSNPPRVALPVLCIGNFTVGGAGKTPTAIAFAQALKARGLVPGIVSRGYGGNYGDLHLVDVENDNARQVGDEPLLLARHASVALSANRLNAAHFLQMHGCNFIIMDDGFQSARLYADFSLLVVDAGRGIGNGKVIPAGPLRAPMVDQMRKTDALLRIGRGDAADYVIRQAARAGRPVFEAQLIASSRGSLTPKRWLAFAGIGNPDKFYTSLRQAGGDVAVTRSFADHHAFSSDDLSELQRDAAKAGLGLITTAKDYVRIATMIGAPQGFVENLAVLDIALQFDNRDAPTQIIDQTIERYRKRSSL